MDTSDKPSWFFTAEDGCVKKFKSTGWAFVEEDEDGEKLLLVPIPKLKELEKIQEVIRTRHGAKASGEGFYDAVTGTVQFTAGSGGLQ